MAASKYPAEPATTWNRRSRVSLTSAASLATCANPVPVTVPILATTPKHTGPVNNTYVFVLHTGDVRVRRHFLQQPDAQVDPGDGRHVVHDHGHRARVGHRREMIAQRVLLENTYEIHLGDRVPDGRCALFAVPGDDRRWLFCFVLFLRASSYRTKTYRQNRRYSSYWRPRGRGAALKLLLLTPGGG